MSASVSQIEFWREANLSNKENNDTGTTEGAGATYLSYDVFMGLSVLGGFLGLDHLYLRSPVTALAKFIINSLFFGVWWIYDAAQAIFNTDIVKIYGLGIPGFGPKGIASGVLANDVPDKKHMRFLIYSAGLIFGGMIGLDAFIVGNKQSGIIRLISMISIIFAPLAIGWWMWNMFRFFTNTKEVVSEHSTYFGAPTSSVQDQMLARFPFLGALFSPMESIQRIINEFLGPVIQPLANTAKSAITTVDHVVETADHAIELGRNALSKGTEIVGQIASTVDSATKAFSAASSVVPGAALYASITPEALEKETSNATVAAMAGGALIASDLNPLHVTLIGTIVLLAITGFAVTYYRSTHVPRRDDSPPEPGVFRESDRKKHSP
jgi:uncharacterized membrane protein/TM2 domain-containing membrane protein YozV